MVLTVSASKVVWVSEPDDPVKETLAVPLTADADAVRLTFWLVPGERTNLDGVAVTPWGKPAIVTCTELLKPLPAIAIMEMDCAAPPSVMPALASLNWSEKSAEGFSEFS